MTRQPFRLPDIGEGTAEAELVAWHVAPGDIVSEDQPLCDVMTDKATVEVTSPIAGRIIERTGSPGEMLAVGSTILVFEIEAIVPDTPTPPPAAEVAKPKVVLPAVTRTRALAAPALRKRATDLGIDLGSIEGSGPHGRIRQSDLEAHLRRLGTTRPSSSTLDRPHLALDDDDAVEEIPVIGLRRRIAERMQDTKRRIPHFSYIEEVNVSQLEVLRAQLAADTERQGTKLTLLPFLIRALAKALPDFPEMNAHYDDDRGVIRRYQAVHAGIATQTPSGLVVAVLRNAQWRDLGETATELTRLASSARAGRAPVSELTGSTITITSLGAMGGVATTPVINSPEVAIIGVNKIVQRPVVRDGTIEIAKMMNLSSSFDHRVVDGWNAASFIQRIKVLLEHPALLFMG